MIIKNVLLKYISENDFDDICDFIEELYLMEYDILILMARKFYNLFCVFHEINCEKYERLGISYLHKRKVITNRALPLIKSDIRSGKINKIIIADDIIIHGRSIREVYDDLIMVCPELEITLISYYRNEFDTDTYKSIIEKVQSRYFVDNSEWRELSNKIVDTFYLYGRPYISYLPTFLVDVEWDELKCKLSSNNCFDIQNDDMKKYEVHAFSYMGKEIEIFQSLPCCNICAIRFYFYSKINKIIVVPYFCMNEGQNNYFNTLSNYLREHFLKKEYNELLLRNDNADEMRVMELEYVLSAWLGMFFLSYLNIPIKKWYKEIEDYNFLKNILLNEILPIDNIKDNISQIEKTCKSINNKIEYNNNEILLEQYNNLKTIYIKNFERWNTTKSWNGSKISYAQRFLDHYLAINGNIDEERCKNNTYEKKRLFGISVSYILNDMSDFLYELYGGKESKEYYYKLVFSCMIEAVDSGRGTIVTKVQKEDSFSKYYESVIYAGEQNYKFYEITNFAIMYGMFLIEYKTKCQEQFNLLESRKTEMMKRFETYLEQEGIFYIKEEILQITNRDISIGLKSFLLQSFDKYSENITLKNAIIMALDICNN